MLEWGAPADSFCVSLVDTCCASGWLQMLRNIPIHAVGFDSIMKLVLLRKWYVLSSIFVL